MLIRDTEGGFDPLALRCTDLKAKPLDIIADYVCHWQLEVTFEDARAHLGLEHNCTGRIKRSLTAPPRCSVYSRW
jgi:hypothetical protein